MKKKSVWIKADEGGWEQQKERITTGLESGADCVLVNPGDVGKTRELGSIPVATFGRDNKSGAEIIVVGKRGEGDGTKPLPLETQGSLDINAATLLRDKGVAVGGYVIIKDKRYEQFAAELGKVCDFLIVTGTDWKVIPLENLIAELQRYDVKIIFGVKSAEEAKLAFQTLETGADGVLLDSGNIQEIKDTIQAARELENESAELESAVVTRVEPLGMGDRVCVDTCNLMQKGEGMLIGSQASGMFLVNSESDDSPYVAARPFRVNAGAVHSYIKIGDKTRYLSELRTGDAVTIIDSKGRQREGFVGRVKIESRPLMLIEAKAGNRILSAILQNAETIKLVGKDGNPISVAKLKKGDEVLVRLEEGARHFGKKIEETIIEK
ncbi:MAG TPA: 3-dehydroquinate synthase II [Methanosarcina vacuolata]|uniref:3-dehydroquinate synthase II n=1 Tax=Methanosarcina sp. Kolksee TaxID=1434099 RepID=UPI0006156EE9|nr:3-dehydroquinate synthase II [Methanosarcina sp. Kolksee]AKB49177.1 3,7-dideoxy-D-threo-hepto-2, 6-diulosonate synthase [Methanosarcina sp. Kolksee]HNW37405.1 3-dehydroquinate synthase II [Methanosarcina vacuolata]